jgi:hypothetical protein
MLERKRRSSVLVSLVLFVTVLVATTWAVSNRQYIIDSIRAYQFVPSKQVAAIKERLALTPRGSFLFDASSPSLQSADEFNESCRQRHETNNPIIGCYVDKSIYIFEVSNDELNGIEETTAAHELLHAVYERLDQDEREKLDTELSAAYERVKTPELSERMKYYEVSEPGHELNEIHSILGTENIDLGHTLEEHYKKYFTARNKIVTFHDSYSSTFNRVTDQLRNLEKQINSQVATINTRIQSYNARIELLSADTDSFNQRSAAANSGMTQEQFTVERSALTARKQALDDEYSSIQSLITSVESLRSSHGLLVEQYNQLNRSLNSTLDPTPAL